MRQPHPYGCLPTCVQVVRRFYGERLTYEEASEQCDEQPGGGCLWEDSVVTLSLQYEVREVAESDDDGVATFETLANIVNQERKPVIVELQWQGWAGVRHAVVVVGVDEQTVTVMNPAGGQNGRMEELTRDDFLLRWDSLGLKGFYFDEEPPGD